MSADTAAVLVAIERIRARCEERLSGLPPLAAEAMRAAGTGEVAPLTMPQAFAVLDVLVAAARLRDDCIARQVRHLSGGNHPVMVCLLCGEEALYRPIDHVAECSVPALDAALARLAEVAG